MAYPSGDEASLHHSTCSCSKMLRGDDFQSVSPKFSRCFSHRMHCGASLHVQRGGSRAALVGTSWTRACCGVSLAPCCQGFAFFPAVGEKKAGRQLLLQDWGQQELCWPPRDLEPFREGMQHVLATFLCKQLQILGFPPKKLNFCLRQCRMGRRERLR